MQSISKGQIISLKAALRTVDGVTSDAYAFIVNQLLPNAVDVDSLSDLTRGQWVALRDKLYPNWRDEDWSLCDDKRRRIAEHMASYREQVLGQKRLF